MNVLERLRRAFAAATPEGGDASAFAAAVRPSTDAKFGDYQANGCMALAKRARQNPREMALAVASRVDLAPLADPPEVAGPRLPQRPAPRRLAVADPGRPGRRRVAGSLPARDAQDGRHRLFVAQRRQADARRPRPLDGHRRQPGTPLLRAGAPGDPRQPPRRLGLAVRHDPLGLEESPRRIGLRGRPRGRTRPAVPAGPVADQGRRVAGGTVRQGLRAREPGEVRRGRRGLRQAGGGDGADARRGRPRHRRGACRRRRRPGRDRQAARGRPREPLPLGALHAALPGRAPGGLRPPRRPVRRRARRELLRPHARRGGREPPGSRARRGERGGDGRLRRGGERPVPRPQARRRLQLRDHRPGDDPVSRPDLEPRPDPLRGRPPAGGPFQGALRRRPPVGL